MKTDRSGPSRIAREDSINVIEAAQPEIRRLESATLLVTGATGFIGRHLIEALSMWNAAQNHPVQLLLPVRSVRRMQRAMPHLAAAAHLKWIEWAEDTPLAKLLAVPADYIVHAASPADPQAYMQNPQATMRAIVHLTEQVVDYGEQVRAKRLLYLSSGAVYGTQPPDLAGLPEDYLGAPRPTAAGSCYGEAKRFSELLCFTSRIPSTAARIYVVLGPHQDLNGSFAVPNFIHQAMVEKRIRINSDGRALRTFCYSSDITVSLLKLLLVGEPGQSYNVGSRGPVLAVLQLAEAIAAEFGNPPIEVVASPGFALPPRYTPDISKLEQIYRPQVPFETGLKRVITYLREEMETPVS